MIPVWNDGPSGRARAPGPRTGNCVYTLNPGRLIELLARCMKPGGELWMRIARCEVEAAPGTSLPLGDFLIHTGLFEKAPGAQYLFTRTHAPAGPVSLELTGLSFRPGKVPYRGFRVLDPVAWR